MRILLADDHTLVRQGLRRVIEGHQNWQVVAEAGTGEAGIQLAAEHKPDVAIVDIAMPGLSGLSAIPHILNASAATRVIVLSMHADQAYVVEALDAGAAGYLLKEAADTELFQAIDAVFAGQRYISRGLLPLTTGHAAHAAADPYLTLTPRERDVFRLVAEAHTNKDIAACLGISATTVETHRARVLEKLDLHSAAEVARYAVRRGLVS